MSPLILSACLLSSVTKPLSPAEFRSPPTPGSVAYARYVLRAAASVRKGMTGKEAEAILGPGDFAIFGPSWQIDQYLDLGLEVTYRLQEVAVGGRRERELRVQGVEFLSPAAFRLRAVITTPGG
jgi:hypothetical protein